MPRPQLCQPRRLHCPPPDLRVTQLSPTMMTQESIVMARKSSRKCNWEFKKEEIQKFRTCGAVSKNLYDRLEVFKAQPVLPEHVLNPACKQCSKCTLCMEQGGQTCVEWCQTEGFKDHLWRIPHADGGHHFEVD